MKHYGIIIAVGLALGAGTAWSQPQVEWAKSYGGESYDLGSSVIQLEDGGFAISGSTSLGGAPDRVLLVRTNPDGDSLWSRTYGNIGEVAKCNSLIQTSDGGFAMAGALNGDFWFVKTNRDGDSLWSRRFDGQGPGGGVDECLSLIQTVDGGFTLAGYRDYIEPGRDFTHAFFWIVRTDDNGDSLWTRSYGGWNDVNECYSILQTADGGFAMAGMSNNHSCLIRTDANGDSIWSRSFCGGGDEGRFSSLIQSVDGGFALAGTTYYPESNGRYNFWLLQIADNGDSLWSRTFGGANDDWCYSLIQTRDGGYAMAGETNSFGAGNNDFWLLRTNSDGDSLWSCTFGGEEDDPCHSLIQTADGGFALAGTTSSFDVGGFYNFYLVKTTPDPVSVRDSGFIFHPLSFILSPAYPNPFNSSTLVSFDLAVASPLSVRIYDLSGRQVTTLVDGYMKAGQHTTVWNASAVASGVYLVRMEAAGKSVNQKVTLVR